MDTTKLLGRNIRFHLFRTELTLKDAAENVGISAYSLGRVASGKTKLVDPNLLTDLMQVFNCDANALLMPIEGVPYNDGSQSE
jgi:transcriptional regulator with XRE-family HTH domain